MDNSDPMLQSRYFSGVLLTDGKQDYTTKQLQFTESQSGKLCPMVDV